MLGNVTRSALCWQGRVVGLSLRICSSLHVFPQASQRKRGLIEVSARVGIA